MEKIQTEQKHKSVRLSVIAQKPTAAWLRSLGMKRAAESTGTQHKSEQINKE